MDFEQKMIRLQRNRNETGEEFAERVNAAFRAAPPAPVSRADGWQLVPVEPTREMWDAVNKLDDEMAAGGYDGKGCSIEQAWNCMLAAAPQSAPHEGGSEGVASNGSDESALTKAIWQNISELPDRNSPEDEPDACVCNFNEFSGCVENALEDMNLLAPQGVAAPQPVAVNEGGASPAVLTMDAGEVEFLAARLRRLFNHFKYSLPKWAKDDKKLIGIAPSCIGAVLANLAASPTPASGALSDYSYQQLFDAIAAATCVVAETAVGISVIDFRAAIAASQAEKS